ncbi:hypothetical protein BaRGS_00040334, partial [Batillaria attramentaria]
RENIMTFISYVVLKAMNSSKIRRKTNGGRSTQCTIQRNMLTIDYMAGASTVPYILVSAMSFRVPL